LHWSGSTGDSSQSSITWILAWSQHTERIGLHFCPASPNLTPAKRLEPAWLPSYDRAGSPEVARDLDARMLGAAGVRDTAWRRRWLAKIRPSRMFAIRAGPGVRLAVFLLRRARSLGHLLRPIKT